MMNTISPLYRFGTFTLLGLLLASCATPLAHSQSIRIPDSVSLDRIDSLDVIYVDGHQTPSIEVRHTTDQTTPVPATRLSGVTSSLLSRLRTPQTSKGCRIAQDASTNHWTIRPRPHARCRVIWATTDPSLDLLSFSRLRLVGSTSHPITLALTDGRPGHLTRTVPLVQLAGPFDQSISLDTIGRTLDLRTMTGIVIDTDHATELTWTHVTGEQTPPPPQPSLPTGFWIWHYREVVQDPARTLTQAREAGAQRLLIQLPALQDPPALWASYTAFLERAHTAGFAVYVLDGSPDGSDHPEPLLDKLARVQPLMQAHIVEGIQLDLEPYLLPQFGTDPRVLDRYLNTLETVHTALHEQGHLSVVIPFWFSTLSHRGYPVAFSVLNRADDVAVMTYRTTATDVLALGLDTLRYGQLQQIPVWFALETTPLPTERHVVFRTTTPSQATGYIDDHRQLHLDPPAPSVSTRHIRQWVAQSHEYVVHPERLTHAGGPRTRVRALIQELHTYPDSQGLSGILIHDLAGYQALPAE